MRDAGRRAASEMPAGVGLDGRAEVGVVVGLEADEMLGTCSCQRVGALPVNFRLELVVA